MHIPRSDYVSFVPQGFFPISGNDTLELTCLPGPCAVPGGSIGPTAQCVAIFSSIGKSVTRNVTYCVEQTPKPVATAATKSNFQTFTDAFGEAFGTIIQLLAWILALAVFILGFIAIVVVLCVVAEMIKQSKYWPKSETAATETTASQSASGQESAGNEMVNMPASSAEEATGSGATEESAAENASQMSDDATQYDESETAHLISTKETV